MVRMLFEDFDQLCRNLLVDGQCRLEQPELVALFAAACQTDQDGEYEQNALHIQNVKEANTIGP
jgi:hypothetical protein